MNFTTTLQLFTFLNNPLVASFYHEQENGTYLCELPQNQKMTIEGNKYVQEIIPICVVISKYMFSKLLSNNFMARDDNFTIFYHNPKTCTTLEEKNCCHQKKFMINIYGWFRDLNGSEHWCLKCNITLWPTKQQEKQDSLCYYCRSEQDYDDAMKLSIEFGFYMQKGETPKKFLERIVKTNEYQSFISRTIGQEEASFQEFDFPKLNK